MNKFHTCQQEVKSNLAVRNSFSISTGINNYVDFEDRQLFNLERNPRALVCVLKSLLLLRKSCICLHNFAW